MDNKTCKVCGETKSLSDFSVKSSGKKGANFRDRTFSLKDQCKACDAAYAREFRKRNKNYKGSGKITKFANRALASAIGSRLIDAKQRCKKKDQEITVSKEFLYDLFEKQKGLCAISKEPLSIEQHKLNTLSLDKINPDNGYIEGNVQWLAWAVNRAKGEMTQEMFLTMCRVITEKCND